MLSVLATLWALVLSLALRPVIALPPSNTYHKSRSTVANRISTRQDEEPDPDDLSFIKNIAAIGDSYSAGIGAGERLGSLLNPLEGSGRYNFRLTIILSKSAALQQMLTLVPLQIGDAVVMTMLIHICSTLTADWVVLLHGGLSSSHVRVL